MRPQGGAPTQTRRAAAAALAALEYVRAAASLCSLKRKASTVVRLTAGVRRQAWIMVPRAMPLAVFRLPSCFSLMVRCALTIFVMRTCASACDAAEPRYVTPP